MRRILLLSMAGALLLAACSSGAGSADTSSRDSAAGHAPSMAALEGLKKYRKLERERYNARDITLTDLFAQDAIIQSCGAGTLRGRAALRSFFQNEYWPGNKAEILQTSDDNIVEVGDYLIVSGSFTVGVEPKGGAYNKQAGRYLAVFKKDASGNYLLWRESGLDAEPVRAPKSLENRRS